jgi:hypothetical protein
MGHPKAAEPTRQVVLQRIRNRVIEYLELASSYEDQREYQSRVPIHVPNEIVNQWEDWVQCPGDLTFSEPVFSAAERDAVVRFHAVWDEVANNTPDPLPDVEDLFVTEEWRRLRDAALDALQVFRVRGKLSEDHEIVADR